MSSTDLQIVPEDVGRLPSLPEAPTGIGGLDELTDGRAAPRSPDDDLRPCDSTFIRRASLAVTADTPDEGLMLRLYVAGQSPRSLRASANLRRLCENELAGKYRVEIVDLITHPELARQDEIVAIPTLVRPLPEPFRKIIGDLSDTERTGLELPLASCSERLDDH